MQKAFFVKAGDTFFTHSTTLLGRLIRWGETDPGEVKGSTWANHAGVVVEDGWIGEPLSPQSEAWDEVISRLVAGRGASLSVALVGPTKQAVVIEALWHTRKGPLVLGSTLVRVFRPVPAYDEHERERFALEAETFVGDKYGWWKLGAQLADRLAFKGRKVIGALLFKKDRPICSFLAGFVNHMAQGKERVSARVLAGLVNGAAIYAFGVPPQSCDPDGMLDWCEAHPQQWQEVI